MTTFKQDMPVIGISGEFKGLEGVVRDCGHQLCCGEILVRFETYNHNMYVSIELVNTNISPEAQEALADQKRRQAHANKYL